MQAHAFLELTGDDLANVVGGQATGDTPPPQNRQDSTIGVKADKNGVSVGMNQDGTRSNYGMCLDAGVKGNWTPEQIKDTCGLPPP